MLLFQLTIFQLSISYS